MEWIDNFQRIPDISDADLAALAAQIRPLVRVGGRLHFVAFVGDCRKESYLWDAEAGDPFPNNYAAGSIVTFHTYGAPALFKPSVAEVLAQVKSQVPAEWLPRLGAFLIESDDLDARNALSDGYHYAVTRLYETPKGG